MRDAPDCPDNQPRPSMIKICCPSTYKIEGIGCNAYTLNITTATVSSGEKKLGNDSPRIILHLILTTGNPKAKEAYLEDLQRYCSDSGDFFKDQVINVPNCI